MNKATIVGRVGRDPEMRNTGQGQAVVNLSVATTERWTGRDGQRQERTEWHVCVFWGKPAEVVAKWVRKGDMIALEGRITHRDWTDRQGNKRKSDEISVTSFDLIGPTQRAEGRGELLAPQDNQDADIPDENIPF